MPGTSPTMTGRAVRAWSKDPSGGTRRGAAPRSSSQIVLMASLDADDVLERLGSQSGGLSAVEAARRRTLNGPNALLLHHARPWHVLGRQLKSPVLVLLLVTAVLSALVGETTSSAIIGVILAASVGLGFTNEYRAERQADTLHDTVLHTSTTLRDASATTIAVTELVPGDVVRVTVGAVVPADLRLLDCHDLSCDESILTGESLPVAKDVASVPAGSSVADLTCCLLMGTVVQSGTASAVVVDTGSRTQFGQVAVALGTQQPQTEFQRGLGRFSLLLLQVAIILTSAIFAVNVVLDRPVVDSLLFSLAIAVGITPQLLPAVVSSSLATGSRALARQKVLVKRLVCIEDLGDMDVLVTDKTGTLTEGTVTLDRVVPVVAGVSEQRLLLLGLLATGTTEPGRPASLSGLDALDAALWRSPAAHDVQTDACRRIDLLPFDHDRRRVSVLVDLPQDGRMVVSKGAPEDLLPLCTNVPPGAHAALTEQYAAGARVVAVAHASGTGYERLSRADETGLTLDGFLVLLDPPKAGARTSIEALSSLGITVKIATGDNAAVAEKVLTSIGITSAGTLTGADVDALEDDALRTATASTTIFARVSPAQKARVVRALRRSGRSVAFLGDGVNDALALHEADIGISVDTAADVAKDAADVLLLDKDLAVLAAGVREGRRIFSNTVKYVLMGSSSNCGNMFSAAVASLALPFLPMTAGQILTNNLLYDTGQLSIPSDRVDPEQLLAPSHWDIAFIRRFMLLFGTVSSFFDAVTFVTMIVVLQAGQSRFQSGWFIESIATQTLIIFVIRTRRTPFFRSRPSVALTGSSVAVVAAGVWLPYSPLSSVLGFQPLPATFFLVLVVLVVSYLVVVEVAKVRFFAWDTRRAGRATAPARLRGHHHRVARRAGRFIAHRPSKPTPTSALTVLGGTRHERRHL